MSATLCESETNFSKKLFVNKTTGEYNTTTIQETRIHIHVLPKCICSFDCVTLRILILKET
jgi:hypothetical protein